MEVVTVIGNGSVCTSIDLQFKVAIVYKFGCSLECILCFLCFTRTIRIVSADIVLSLISSDGNMNVSHN